MNRTQNHRRCFVLLVGFCMAGLLLAGCDDGAAPPSGIVTPGQGQTVTEYDKDASCVVCSEKLGSKGDPLLFMHDAIGSMVCSQACGTEFKKDPAKYVTAKVPATPTP